MRIKAFPIMNKFFIRKVGCEKLASAFWTKNKIPINK